MPQNSDVERRLARAYPFIELTAEELDRLVGTLPGALAGTHVTAARSLTSGLRNTNYRLELSNGWTAVLRLYVADPAACMLEYQVLEALNGRLPVPWILAVDETADPPLMLLQWLAGRPLDEVLAEADATTTFELAAVCGTALARIHETRFPEAGFLGPGLRVVRPMPAWAPAVLAALAGRVEEHLGPSLSAGVRRTVEEYAGLVEPVWSEAVLVHADYKPWNLLVRAVPRESSGRPGDGQALRWVLAGILDWEFACAGCKLIDFATFLRDEGSRPAGFSHAFSEAYLAAGGTLPAEWRRLTSLVDLLNLMQLLDWADEGVVVGLRELVAATVEAR